MDQRLSRPYQRSRRTDGSTELDQRGFIVIPNAVPLEQVGALIAALEPLRERSAAAGLRALLRDSQVVHEFAAKFGREVVAPVVGAAEVFAVRGILFDKTPVTNWYVTWHQDKTIPVRERREVEGFRAWSEKDGVVHVQPPAEVLARVVSARIALDPCGITNGAIKFIEGSHRHGIMDDATIAEWRDTNEQIDVPCEVGDTIFMRPLILHASSKSEDASSRRILHIEYACGELPGGLNWAQC